MLVLGFCSLEAFCAIDGRGVEGVGVWVRGVGGSGLGMDGYRGGSGGGAGVSGVPFESSNRELKDGSEEGRR